MAFLPSNLGFQQLTTNSPCQQRYLYSANGVMTTRHHSRFLSTSSQRLERGLQLESLWRHNSPKSSNKDEDKDDSKDDSKDDEEEKTDEVEKKPQDEDVETSSSSSSSVEATSSSSSSSDTIVKSPTTTDSEKSLSTMLNELGNNFKAMAQKSTAKGYQCEDRYKKILYAVKSCVYYTLFILYRSYRGFFVLLPATFRQVYQKMEAAMNTGNLSLEEISFPENGNDSVSSSSTTWKTKLTVSLLASVVTISYVFGGILKMASKFIRTIAKTSNVSKSFEAAADEVVNFEGRISRVGKINGEEDIEPSGLAP